MSPVSTMLYSYTLTCWLVSRVKSQTLHRSWQFWREDRILMAFWKRNKVPRVGIWRLSGIGTWMLLQGSDWWGVWMFRGWEARTEEAFQLVHWPLPTLLQAGKEGRISGPINPARGNGAWLPSQRVPRANINGASNEDIEFGVSWNQRKLESEQEPLETENKCGCLPAHSSSPLIPPALSCFKESND